MIGADIVRAFWADMASNDFHAATRWFGPHFTLHWPQSDEVIAGADSFAALTGAYAASGAWQVRIDRLTGADGLYVSEVAMTAVTARARAVTFHWIEDKRIARQVEYWPDAFDAPDWRRPWTRMDASPH